MARILEERARERERLLGLARDYVERLSKRVTVVAAAVAGSVARGDFNVWSDVDVVVVAEGLPGRIPDRMSVLVADAPAGVQPVGFTPGEFRTAWVKGNPLVTEAVRAGVVLTGDEFVARLAGSDRSEEGEVT